MTQEDRHKIYLAIVAVIGLAVTFGLIDQATATLWVSLVADILAGVFAIATAVGVIMAAVKSNPKTTAVIEVPKDTVVEVITTAGHPNVDANSEPIAA